MSTDYTRARDWVVAAIIENPAASVTDPDLLARLDDRTADCTFEELDFDSLASMELCIYIECETSVALSTGDLQLHPSVNRLAEHLHARLAEEGR